MKFHRANLRTHAFTLVELLVVMAIIGILAALLLPALSKGEGRAKRVLCENNLQQMGIAFHIFMHDHDGRFPMQVSTNEGGTLEFMLNNQSGFVFRNFQTLSGELTTPRMLVCPTDTRQPAMNFAALENENISYFAGANADFAKPDSILSGDRNITPGGARLRWTQEMHQFKGNVLFADDHVEEWNNSTPASAANSSAAGNIELPSDQPSANPNPPGAGGSSPMPGPTARTVNPSIPPAVTTLSNPPAQPRGNSLSSQTETQAGKISPGQTESQNLPGTSQLASITTIAPIGKVATSDETEFAMSTFDRHIVRFLQNFIEWGYLLLLLILLLLLALEVWRRKKKRATDQIRAAHYQESILDSDS